MTLKIFLLGKSRAQGEIIFKEKHGKGDKKFVTYWRYFEGRMYELPKMPYKTVRDLERGKQ